MAYEPKLIAPFDDSGLKKWYKPWITGSQAFPQLADAYARRGVVRKREGIRVLATLPSESGSAPPVQGIKIWVNPSTLNENLICFSLKKSYYFNDTTQLFQDITFFAYPTGVAVPVTGAPFSFSNGTNDYFWTSNFAGSMWTTNNLTADHIKYWNGTTGVINVSGGWNTFQPIVDASGNTLDASLIILPYKGRLVALNTKESTGNFPNRARFSQLGTPYAGAASPVSILTITVGATTAFTTASDTFTTGQNISFFGVTGADANLLNGVNGVVTRIGAGSYTVNINTAGKMINNSGFVQQQGNPPNPFSNQIFAWRSDIPGRGGFIDADTSERIVSVAIVKDTLIVFFQRSTWRLRYTGNEVLPFIWERLNTQYGSECPYGTVVFDDAALTFSRYGWIASDTNDVGRIDLDIPDDSFAFEAVSVGLGGLNKVQAIRDYYRNFAYFSYIPIGQNTTTQIYGYNYIDKSWTIFNPQTGTSGSSTPLTINTFGAYRNSSGDFTWATLSSSSDTWENYNDEEDTWSNFGAGQNIDFPYTLGGDLNGNVYLMFEFFQAPSNDNGTNFNFSIFTKRFNPYINQGMKCRLGFVDLYCTTMVGGEITLNHYVDDQDSPVLTRTVEIFSRGVISITNITPGATTTITTTLNYELTLGQVITISDITGNIGRILNNGNFLVGSIIDTKNFTINDLSNNPINSTGYTYVTDGFLYNAELIQGDSHYTRIYLGAIAHMHQIQLTLTPNQLKDEVKGVAQFEMQGLVIWTRPAGRIRG